MIALLPAPNATSGPKNTERFVESPEYQAWLNSPAGWQSYLGQSMTGQVDGVRKPGVVAGVVRTATGIALQVRGDDWYEDVPVRDVCGCTECAKPYREWEMCGEHGTCLTCCAGWHRQSVTEPAQRRPRVRAFAPSPQTVILKYEPPTGTSIQVLTQSPHIRKYEAGDLVIVNHIWYAPIHQGRGVPRWLAEDTNSSKIEYYRITLFDEDLRELKAHGGYAIGDLLLGGDHRHLVVGIYVSRNMINGLWRMADFIPQKELKGRR